MADEFTLELIADYGCDTGEGPMWHADERKLYWSDIPAGRLYCYDPTTGQHACCYRGRPVGGYTVQADGALLLFRDGGNVVTWRDGEVRETVIESVPEVAGSRFNDVHAEPLGGVYCGTMSGPNGAGCLYRLAPPGELRPILTDQGTPNGMALAPDRRTLYYNDSKLAKTWAFDYGEKDARLTGQRVFRNATAAGDRGHPDGLTVDAEGGVWTARWNGGCVLRFKPDGNLDRLFEVPEARNVSSLVFAPRWDETNGVWSDALIDLYVTTAGRGDRETYGAKGGALFRMRFDGDPYRGMPEFRSRAKMG